MKEALSWLEIFIEQSQEKIDRLDKVIGSGLLTGNNLLYLETKRQMLVVAIQLAFNYYYFQLLYA